MELFYEVNDKPYSIYGVDSVSDLIEKGNLSNQKYIFIIDNSVKNLIDLELVGSKCIYLDYNGETDKNLDYAQTVLSKILKFPISRRSCLVVVGGAGISDIIGYIASQLMRGVDWIQVPTTLMAMVDCTVGKVAINFKNRKNILGAFNSPNKVIIDFNLLETMPEYLIKEGLVESVKCAFSFNDTDLKGKIMDYIENKQLRLLRKIIERSIVWKISVVQNDFYDTNNIQKAVSYGHTFANVFEEYKMCSHGIAVLNGMLLASFISCKRNYIQNNILEEHHFFFNWLSTEKQIVFSDIDIKDFIEKMKRDKITKNNEICAVLLKNHSFEVSILDEEEVHYAISKASEIQEIGGNYQ